MSTPDYSQRKAAMKVYLSCSYLLCMHDNDLTMDSYRRLVAL